MLNKHLQNQQSASDDNCSDISEDLKVIESDFSVLHLGNLHTVDTDLKLPATGRNGTTFTWTSQETRYLNHDGRITRPLYGMGNRTVVLQVTGHYGEAVLNKKYKVTILEVPRGTHITELLPVHLMIETGHKLELPSVVIAKEDVGLYTTLPVHWEELPSTEKTGVFHINGSVDESTQKASAVITVKDSNKNTDSDKKSVGDTLHFPDPGQVILKPGSIYYDAEQRMLQFLAHADDDQMLYNFRDAAGLDLKKSKEMTGWDAPDCHLKGHTTGHYLSAIALAWTVTGNTLFRRKIHYMTTELRKCQLALEKAGAKKGFLSGYSEEQFDLLEKYTPYPKIWAPYYTLDKIMSGLYDCYTLAHDETAYKILCDMGDWVYLRLSRLSREQLDKMWAMYIAGEFGGMISVMAKLYQLTGKEIYRYSVDFFRNDKLFYPMKENKDTLRDLHANQHIPQILGALDWYFASGNEQYYQIAQNFWNMTITEHAYCNGGVGESELFHAPGKNMDYLTDKTAESCASYNLLRLTAGLFQLHPDSKKMDYYENVLTNHILATASHNSDGGTIYFLPMAPGEQKEYTTDENTCCHGTGLESRFRYIQNIYALNQNICYVNLFVPSILRTDEIELELTEIQHGHYKIQISQTNLNELALRIPQWTKKGWHININQSQVPCEISDDGYVHLNLEKGKPIILEIRFRYTLCTHTDGSYLYLTYGPYLLAAENSSKHFLKADNIIKELHLTAPDRLEFSSGKVKLYPLYQLDKESYHIYFKI